MQHLADAPSVIATVADTLDLPLQHPVVVTLVHGTVLFARWPRILLQASSGGRGGRISEMCCSCGLNR